MSVQFHRHGGCFTAADAEAGNAALQIALLQCVQKRHHDACARRANGMAERAGAAIDVTFSCGMANSRMAASVTTANASLIS
jgi:hypothetical protein